MSDYDSLKKELQRISRLVSHKNREIKQIQDELAAIEKEKTFVKADADASMTKDKNQKYKEHLSKLVGPIEQTLLAAKKDLSDEENDFKSSFSELTTENFLEQCTDTKLLLQQIQEMSSSLRIKLQGLVGERLYKSVYDSIQGNRITLDVNDLDRAIAYFNDCEEKVSHLTEKPDYLGDFICKAESRLETLGADEKVTGTSAIVRAIALLLGFLILNKFVFPFYLLIILTTVVYHVFRTYNVYKILLLQKSIADNIESIEEKLRAEATEAAEQARAELQQEHDERISFLQERITQLNEKQMNAMNASKESFYYDGSVIKRALDSKMINLEKREADSITNLTDKRRELEALTSEYEELKSKMGTVFSSQQNAYLSYETAGEEFVLNTKFLLDIDDITKKITFFDFPCDSALFIYRDREDAIAFIKLINVQIRTKLHPSCYEVVYYDPINMGQDCFFFVPEVKDNDPAARLFKISSTEESYSEILNNYSSDMKSRQTNFRQDRTIDVYNKHMLEIESLTMSYYFSFVLDPSQQLIKKMGVVTKAAGMYGIYICTFISEKDLQNLGRGVDEVVDIHNIIYVIQDGKVNTRAKDFILSQFSDQKRP